MKSKKGTEAVFVVVWVMGALLVFVIIGFFLSFNSRECNSNDDCKEDQYCGYDFKCHNHPVIVKEVVNYKFPTAAMILGICLVISAIIFRAKRKEKQSAPVQEYQSTMAYSIPPAPEQIQEEESQEEIKGN
jgi:beta-lactamase regulating signal transducer with metallopeptidase domain